MEVYWPYVKAAIRNALAQDGWFSMIQMTSSVPFGKNRVHSQDSWWCSRNSIPTDIAYIS